MAATKAKDLGASFVANGVTTSSDGMLTSPDNVLASSFSIASGQPMVNSHFGNHLRHHVDGNRLPSDGSRETVDLLDDHDLSGLSNSYTETDQQELDEFAQRFNEELEAFNETTTTGGGQDQSFGQDSSGQRFILLDGSLTG